MRNVTFVALATLATQSSFAQESPNCVTNAITDSVGEFTMRFHIHNGSTGDITIGQAHRSTTQENLNTLVHRQDTENESYILADVFDEDGFTRFDVLDDGSRREVFRVDIESCEEESNSDRRELNATQVLLSDGQVTTRRWNVVYDSFGIMANFYAQSSEPGESEKWQSFYSLVREQPDAENESEG